ncbi:DUF4326 domain-containing protein [Nocardioides carbamazepini]|uniref:DUF4326 domain-containing protein n=1 Tax=Nocardioides carbamazepini TaxID=2854259 RepID=UPI002149FE7B|nr:DUF4326 domain-containing protein [Nocardioides carbamazepini]MCR1785331.1 DUF4326 domain-containing protein [Nocardioides carbamazepini]
MSAPKRIQRQRTKGWRMPEGAVYVGRGSKWGNPFALRSPSGLARVPAVDHPGQPWEYEGRISANGMRHDYFHPDGRVIRCDVRWMTAAESVECYRALLHGDGRWPLDFRHNGGHYPHIGDVHELAGKDLACWCPLDQPCHADVLLEIANAPTSPGGSAATTEKEN